MKTLKINTPAYHTPKKKPWRTPNSKSLTEALSRRIKLEVSIVLETYQAEKTEEVILTRHAKCAEVA